MEVVVKVIVDTIWGNVRKYVSVDGSKKDATFAVWVV